MILSIFFSKLHVRFVQKSYEAARKGIYFYSFGYNLCHGGGALADYESKRNFITNVVFVGLILGLCYVALHFVVPLTLPFLGGLFLAFLLKPITAVITRITAFRRRAAALIVLGLFYLWLTSIILGLAAVCATQLGRLLSRLPELYSEGLEPVLTGINIWLYDLLYSLSAGAAGELESFLAFVLDSVGELVGSLSSAALGLVTNTLRGLPMFVTTVLFTIVSSVLISADYNSVTGFLMRQFSKKHQMIILEAKDFMVGSLFKMIKAYGIILLITLSELTLGLWLLGVELFFPIAAVIAVLDILPLIGTGGILIPWGIIELIRGSYTLGGGLILLFLVITVVRNLLEARIVGAQIGLSPIVTIAAMYIGLRLFGFLGLIAAPMAAILVKHLNDSGKVQIYQK